MTANQRRPGFRLPWTSEEDAEAARATGATPEVAEPVVEAAAAAPTSTDAAPQSADATPGEALVAEPESAAAADAEPPQEFLRELVAAMRKVADESKQSGLADARARAEERVKQLEAEGERRRQELSARAESDITAVGEWAKAEAERIKAEAERRVSARRTQLDEQLAADQARGQADAKAVRGLVADYERELDAYHAQLAEITDPAAFAAAAKRMPRPPVLDASTTPATAPERPAPSAAAPAPAASRTVAADAIPTSANGQAAAGAEVHPAEEEVLAARLAELDASLPPEPAAETTAAPTATATGTPDTTEVVVSGLGSFGAITSFRQALADVDGVQGVALSLGGSGEFVFRATHRAGFDIGAAIASLEGDAAKVQPRPEGGLLVKLERRR